MSPRRLADLTIGDASTAGRKAAALGEMLRAGLPVPAGFVALVDDSDAAIDATARLRDGQRVTVDGSAGIVIVHDA